MIQEIIAKMIAYDKGDVPRIQHFIKVYSFAHMIGELEDISGAELLVLDIAAILHDIGIHPANAIKLRKSSKGIRSMIERRKQTPDRIYQKKSITKRQIKELPERVLTQGKNYDNL